MPRYQWAKATGATITVTSEAITLDKDGNVYTTGTFEGTADFDPGAGVYQLQATGFNDVFVQKLDNNGNFIWAVCISSSHGTSVGNSVKTDASGNVYIVGYFSGQNTDFNPGAAQSLLSSTGDNSAFILKLNGAGQFLWANAIGGTGSVSASELDVDKHGNVFTCGSFTLDADFNPGSAEYNISSSGESDGFVQKTDSAGNFVWVFNIGGKSYDHAATITLDTSGNAYVGGGFKDTVDFNPSVGVVQRIGVYGNDRFVVKINSAGNLVWASTNASIRSEVVNAVYTDAKGYTYAAAHNDIEFMITKYDTTGTIIWDRKIYGGSGVTYSDIATDIAVDDTGNVYTCGYFTGKVDFDPGAGVVLKLSAGPPQSEITDIFLLKLSSTGTFKWIQTIGATGPDNANGMCLDKWNDIYCTGVFDETVDFDPSSGTDSIAVTGYTDMFILKLGQCVNTYDTLNLAGCDSVALNGVLYFASGSYTQTLTNYRGCDSIITVNVFVQRNFVSVQETLCAGDTFYFAGNSITQAGMYYDTLSNIHGCDSVVLLTVTLNPVITQSIIDTICFGEVYHYNGNTLTESGVYPYTFTSSITGCDSVVTIKLNVRANINTLLNALVCNTDYYNFGGQQLNVAGMYTDTFTSVTGCDSVVILNLEKRLFSLTATANGNICVAEEDSVSYQWAVCLNGSSSIIDGATQQTFSAPTNGSYQCILFNAMCMELTNCVTVTGIGIHDVLYKDIVNIYPNPAGNTISLMHSYNGVIELQLINTLGDIVKEVPISEPASTIDISEIAYGIYVVLLRDKNNVLYTSKFVKQ